MSDNPTESYPGLDAAAPAAAAPAFGAPAAPPPPPAGDLESLVAIARMPCSNPECGNATEHPAETGWQQLVSTVPVQDQLYRFRPREAGMAFPTESDFRTAIAAVRPERADEHSLERLRGAWSDEVAAKLADWSESIKSNLTGLSEGWAGADFEAFEATCTETRELVDGILDDIDTTVSQLESTEAAVYSLQGGDSGEIPYPAPQFWIDGDWHSWVSVHIRPAWWHGDCIEYTCQDAEHVLALGGADPELATEIIDYIDERVEHYIAYYDSPVNIERDGLDPRGITIEEAKTLAVQDAMDHYGTLVDSNWGAYDSRHAEINEDIDQRSTDNDGEQRSMRTTKSDKSYPAAADPGHMDLEAPPMEQPTGYGPPQTTEDPSLDPPVAEAPQPENPEDPAEDEELSGGLASGGPGTSGGAFGGMGGPGAPAASAGTGATTGAAIGAGTAGMAAGGAAAGTAGRSSSAMMSGGGGAGMGKPMDDKEREPDVDLVEDENMWGFVNEDDDPYA